MRPSISELKRQFDRAVKNGWLPLIQAAADRYQFGADTLLAIGSRETELNLKYQRVPGDRGHGFSMWQLDIGSHREWIATGAWKDVGKAVMKAADALAAKRSEVRADARRRGLVLSANDIEHVAIAAYNCGSGPALSSYVHSKGQDADRATTGNDYSADVLSRRELFALFLSQQPKSVPTRALPQVTDSLSKAEEANQKNLLDRLAGNEDARNFGRSAGMKAANRLGTPVSTLLAALEAGSIRAWLGVAVVVIGLGVFIYFERRAIRRLWVKVKAKL